MADTVAAHTETAGFNDPDRRGGGSIRSPLPRLADRGFPARAELISPTIVTGAVRLAEFSLIAFVGLLIAEAYVPASDLRGSAQYMIAVGFTSALAIGLLHAMGQYSIAALSSALRRMPRVMLAWMIASAALVAAVFFLKIGPDFSRVWVVLWFVAGGAALIANRLMAAALIQKWTRDGHLVRRAVVFGDSSEVARLIQAMERDAESDIRICGLFGDTAFASSKGDTLAGYPIRGTLQDLISFARSSRVDIAIIALPISAEHRLLDTMRGLRMLPVDIKLWAHAGDLRFAPRTYSTIGSVPFIDVADRPIAEWGSVAKWAFDKSIAALALVLLAPLMALTALAIRLESRGPVLFRQQRYGFNNELIEVLKFRSMYVEACDATASRLVIRDDPRVTRVGHFIRRTSIDELPQLINVLRGELSLVGPRPHALQAKAGARLYDEVVEDYFARHKVKPGITGWAQINGWRGETDTQDKIRKRVEHDLYYIENWSLLLDLYILIKTPFALLKSDNAY